MKAANQAASDAEAEFTLAVQKLGNIVLDGVPAGGEDDYIVLREVGEHARVRLRAARPPRDRRAARRHRHAARRQGLRARASTYLKGVGARLELALMNMGLDRAIAAGFTPLITPTLVRPEIMQGTGFLGAHADEIYYLPDDELYLTGTSEVALAGYHADEILDVSSGPHPLRGLVDLLPPRGRQPRKGHPRHHPRAPVQQARDVQLHRPGRRRGRARAPARLAGGHAARPRSRATGSSTPRPATSARAPPASTTSRRGCPRRAPTASSRSTSNCTTYQARRLDIRHRTESGKTAPVATLNGTLATTRWIVAILETHQQADGSVIVPEALRGYLGGLERFEPVAR